MNSSLKPLKLATAVLIGCGLAASLQAQIGSNWQTDSASHTLQKVGPTAYYNNSSGVETFRIYSGDERSEIRINNDYTSGSHQFEGYVNCRSGANQNSVQQVLKSGGSGDASQVRVYNSSGGTLRVLQTGINLGTGVYGTYVRINCLHYRSTGKIELWFNGSKKSTHNDSGSGTYYFKYGVYVHPENNPQIQWKSIRCWKK